MGFLKRKRNIDELYQEAARLEVQEDVSTKEASVAEKEAIVRRLKKEYGPNWRKIVGVPNTKDLSSLRSFLTSAKSGMTNAGMMRTNNPMLSPIPSKSLPHPVKLDKSRKPTGYYGGARAKGPEDE